jgi:HEAT repeat protein
MRGSRYEDEVIDALIKALEDKEWTVRYNSAAALGKLRVGSAEVMDALLKRLEIEENPNAADAIFEAVSALVGSEDNHGGTEALRR